PPPLARRQLPGAAAPAPAGVASIAWDVSPTPGKLAKHEAKTDCALRERRMPALPAKALDKLLGTCACACECPGERPQCRWTAICESVRESRPQSAPDLCVRPAPGQQTR